jgi:UDP-GlcNAc:undecaprenyl-phosphate/decaprenyl-phosphate GlcNAc-1-phosphate transferase
LRLVQSNMLSAWAVPVLVLGATIFDTTLVTVSRSRRGLLPFATPGKDHAAHRLANLGLGQRGAVLAMYIVGAIGGCLALLVSYSPLSISAAILAFAVLLALAGIAFLERAPFERQTRKPAAATD